MRCGFADFLRIDFFQKFRAVFDFVIFIFIGFSNCQFQRFFNRFFCDLLRRFDFWNRARIETLPVKFFQRVNIGEKPRLHYLHHQMTLLVFDRFQFPFFVFLLQKSARGFIFAGCVIRINQQKIKTLRGDFDAENKIVVSALRIACRNYFKTDFFSSRQFFDFFEKRIETLLKLDRGAFMRAFSAAFDVKFDFHFTNACLRFRLSAKDHRVRILQATPSIFLFQTLEMRSVFVFFADQNRFGNFGKSGNENVRMCRHDQLRSLGSLDHQFGDRRQNIGMQTRFRFFDTNQRRRFGMTKIASKQR